MKEVIESKLSTLVEEKAAIDARIVELRKQNEANNEAILEHINMSNVYSGGIQTLQQLLNENNNEVDSDSRREGGDEVKGAGDCDASPEALAPEDS